MRTSDLPFGSEFSPSQIDLADLLSLSHSCGGPVSVLQATIKDRFFARHGGGNETNREKLAMNCRLGMKAYGLIDEAARLTDFGRTLLKLKDDPRRLYEALARHVLLNLNGLALVQCIRDMTAAGEKVDLTTLRSGLAARGVHYPSGGKHPSMMRLWLAKAGVFVGNRWQIDEDRLAKVTGASVDDFDALSRLTVQQRAFLLALANTGETRPQSASEIVRLAEATYGASFPEKSLPKLVLNALVESGYIAVQKTTAGRGAKPFLISPTPKLKADVIAPMLAQVRRRVDPKLIDLLNKPMSSILDEMNSDERHIAGLALEALAFKLMRLLGMDYVATRLRAQATGGAEVDLIFESARLVFSRWQVQCKNAARVALDDVAKEVGLTAFLKSSAIVIVGTGGIGAEARRYANKIMSESNLCIVMIDKGDLDAIARNPAHVVEAFQREARHAMQLKKLDI